MAKNNKKKNKYIAKNAREEVVEKIITKEPAIITEEVIMNAQTREELEELIIKALEQFNDAKNQAEDTVKQANQEVEDTKLKLEQYKNDIAQIEEKENEFKNLEADCNKKENDVKTLREQLASLDKKIETARNEIQNLKEKSKEIKEAATNQAKEESEKIIEEAKKKADQEKIEIIKQANDEAKNAWQDAVDSVNKERTDLRKKEILLNGREQKIKEQEAEIEDKQELLTEEKEFLKKQREKYISCSPQVVDQYKADLEDEKNKYNTLKMLYDQKRDEYNKLQILLDNFNTELNDGQNSSISEMVKKLQEVTKELDDTKRILEQYPTIDSINEVSDKAKAYDTLKDENEEIKSELAQWREKYRLSKQQENELRVAKKELDATNALNEHLLKELESHKTALESRTGDTCPSLTKVDTECGTSSFEEEIQKIENREKIINLKDIVYHVKNYAGSRPHPDELWYKDDDIRAFLSGMAVSKLIILQGMSGTGKSSLPRIFAESISGFNNLIPVESSWRDRNELLGYYNDFNKKFNAKTFTIELYRCGKKRLQNIPAFMVLDEMNLARIEYYFSDFLSILQEKKEKWLIELVSSDMRTLPMQLDDSIIKRMQDEEPSIYKIWEKIDLARKGNLGSETTEQEKTEITEYLKQFNCLVGAKELIDGRKIRVTDNVWFIGTANNDESTFEITDKVYDRAQVISLNEPGEKVKEKKYEERKRMYLPVNKLLSLFKEAKEDFNQMSIVEKTLKDVRDVMVEEFHTSFGDRMLRQAIDYVAVFTASGGEINTAIDYQLATKVVRKILSSDKINPYKELLKVVKGKYAQTEKIIEKRIEELEDESNY